jgi:hypothetical protein
MLLVESEVGKMHKVLFYDLRKNSTFGFLMVVLTFSVISTSMVFTNTLMSNAKNPPTVLAVEKISSSLLNELWKGKQTYVNVIVETYDHNYKPVKAHIESLGGSVNFEYKYINALAAKMPKDQIITLTGNKNIKKIHLDEMRYPLLT